jgi:hypothetical protein
MLWLFYIRTKSFKPVVIEWLHQHQNAKIIDSICQSKFLARQSHAYAFLASTQYEEDYFQIMKQLL